MMVMLMMILMMSHREVSIFRPFGYEPNALPLRHDADVGVLVADVSKMKKKACSGIEPLRIFCVTASNGTSSQTRLHATSWPRQCGV